MRKRKRYESAEQLEALIDKCRKEQTENAAYCEKLKADYTNIFQWMAVQDINWKSLTKEQRLHYQNEHARAIKLKSNHEQALKGHSRFEHRLKRYKATMAALQTDTFRFVEDKSVTLQKVS